MSRLNMPDIFSGFLQLFSLLIKCPKYLASFSRSFNLFLQMCKPFPHRKLSRFAVVSGTLSFLSPDMRRLSMYCRSWAPIRGRNLSGTSSRTCPNKFGASVKLRGNTVQQYCVFSRLLLRSRRHAKMHILDPLL
jgi:hypothetical protein